MRPCDTSCGPMSCVPMRKDGIPEFVINSSSNPYIVMQWCSDTFVKLQVWSFHKWYRYTTARQYRGLMTNSGTPSFLVGTQDIGPHEVLQCLIHVPILSPLPFYKSLYSFSNFQIFFITSPN